MKKILVLATWLPLVVIAQNRTNSFKIMGDISKVNDSIEWVYLQYPVKGELITDSVKPQNGKYRFRGRLAEPQTGRFRVKYYSAAASKTEATNSSKDMASVFLEKGKIELISLDSFSNIKVIGSAAHDEFTSLKNSLKPFNIKMGTLYAKFADYKKNKDTANMRKMEAEIDLVRQERDESIYASYIRAHPNSPLVLYAIKQYAGWNMDPEKLEPLFYSLPAATRKWPSAIEFKEQIEIAKKTGIGRTAMEFTQNDTLGMPVALSSFRGKYLLIDFWASWCGPCRVENPTVVKAFHKYRDKGFYVLGISLDRPGQKEKWIKAIHDDQLEWTHVSDLKFWENEVAIQYGIRAIPQNLLLDPEGKIIAKNLRGEELDKKLEEIIIEGRKAF